MMTVGVGLAAAARKEAAENLDMPAHCVEGAQPERKRAPSQTVCPPPCSTTKMPARAVRLRALASVGC